MSRIRRTATLSLCSLCAFVLTSCAVGTSTHSVSVAAADDDRIAPVSVEVTNERLSEITVFVLRGDERRLLGRVRPQGKSRFVIPGRLLQPGLDLRLAVESAEGSSGYASEPLLAQPGRTLAFQVQQYVSLSSVRVR